MARALLINVTNGSLAGGSLGGFLCRFNTGWKCSYMEPGRTGVCSLGSLLVWAAFVNLLEAVRSIG